MDLKAQKTLAAAVFEAQKTISPYTTTATVTSISGDTAYVKIAGSDISTPVEASTVTVKPGDTVDLSVSHADTHITGNRSDKSVTETSVKKTTENKMVEILTKKYITSDEISEKYATLDEVKNDIKKAAKTATNFLSYDSTDGLLIGNKTSGSFEGIRAKIGDNSFDILGPDNNVLAHYGTDTYITNFSGSKKLLIQDDFKFMSGSTITAIIGEDGAIIGSKSGAHISIGTNTIKAMSDGTTLNDLSISGKNIVSSFDYDFSVVDTSGNCYFSANDKSTYLKGNDIWINPTQYLYSNRGIKALWNGAMLMSDSHEISLSDTISNQLNGIVLAWSAYVDGVVCDYDWNYIFIPKSHVLFHSGNGVSMFLTNSSSYTRCSKCVYISNNKITGDSNNIKASSTENGLVVDPSSFILRNVYGV